MRPLVVLPAPADKLLKSLNEEIKQRQIHFKIAVPEFWESQAHSTIRTQDRGVIPFVPFPWQVEFINTITAKEQVLKARDVGSSEICVRYLCWRQLKDGGDVLIKADRHDNAKNLIAAARQYLTSLPPGERPQLVTDNETELELGGIGSIKALAQGGGRSERCRYILMTERAFWERVSEELAAVSGSIVAGAVEIIESTANGFNEYHGLWMDEANGYRKTFVGRTANPTHDASWWITKQQLHAGDPGKLAQEYPSTPREAFVASGNCYFDVAQVQVNLDSCQVPILSKENGALKIWQRPIVGRKYVIGADVAEGQDAGNDQMDYDDAVVLDWQTGMQVAALHGQWPLDRYASLLDSLGKQYNNALLGVERNNHGHTVLLALKQIGYPNIYMHDDPTNELLRRKAGEGRRMLGWPTTAKTKPILESELSAAILSQALTSYDKMLWDQCLSYVRHGNGKNGAQGGCHDDKVIAAGIAWQMRKHQYQAGGSGKGLVIGRIRTK